MSTHPAPVAPEPAASSPGGVAVLLVSHDGARWLPGVIEGLAEQTARIDALVAIDTGSRDESADLLDAAYAEVVRERGATGFGQAVRLGLERLDLVAAPQEWVWLLHDDARPAPDALEALLAAAAARPDVDVLGPKLREWPSLRRLLELGVTISGTGRRETGLERGEYDQGQHDQQREVLAVNTAGMLVRRSVLERLGGFDDELPVLGTDLDFGWRAAAAGHTTLVVPAAVVFHAEAAHRGLRPAVPGRTGRGEGRAGRRHYVERRAALFTLLANSRARSLPLQVVRLTLGTVLRMLGLLVVRAPAEAAQDGAALVSVLAQPRRLLAARRRRQALRVAPTSTVRALLAPRWTPYRHGLDAVGDLLDAATQEAADVAQRRRAAAAATAPGTSTGRRSRSWVDEPEPDDYTDSGIVARYLTNPVALVLTAVVACTLVGARVALGSVRGGALSPAPDSVSTWWGLYLDSWHALGQGTAVPAPPYVGLLALLGSVLGPTLAVSAVLLLAAPVALWGGYRFLRVVGHLVSPGGAPRWALAAGATGWAVVPFSSGAWGEGRLGLVVAIALLPWLGHAALGFVDPDADRRWRAGWRTALLLTLVAAFAPVAWLVVLAVVVVLAVAALGLTRTLRAPRSAWGPPAVALLAPVLLLSAWWVPALVHGAGEALLLDTGRLPVADVTPVGLLAGRLGDHGAPTWAGLLLLALAVAALLPRATRVPVLVCGAVVATTTAVAALLALPELGLAALTTPAGLGVPVVVVQGALLTAAVLGAQGVALALARRSADETRSTRASARLAAGLLAAVAVVVPLTGLVWSVVGETDLVSTPDEEVPAYMVQSAVTGPERGVLVVRGSIEDGLTYAVRRGEGVVLGEDEVLALTPRDRALDTTVRQILSRPSSDGVDRLAGLGVEYVLLPAPADGTLAASLDATDGLTQSGADPGTRAWQLDPTPDPGAVDGPGSPLRVALLVLTGLGLLAVVVLSLPTLRGER